MSPDKLKALADRIDHEQLWRRAGLDRPGFTDEQNDRLDAGVNLRRYADLLGANCWRIFPPEPNISYRASTLDEVVRMARRGRTQGNENFTIIKDRYGGGYSRGAYTAWPGDVPGEVDDDDVSATNFWDAHRDALIGLGSTPENALADLLAKQTQDTLPAADEACAARIEDMIRSFGYTTRAQSREVARSVSAPIRRYADAKLPCTKCHGEGYYLSGDIGDPPIQCEACVEDQGPIEPPAP